MLDIITRRLYNVHNIKHRRGSGGPVQYIACVLCHTDAGYIHTHTQTPAKYMAQYICRAGYYLPRRPLPASPQATAQATAQAIYCGQFINHTVHKLRNTSRYIMSGFCDFYGGALPFSEFYDKLRAKITRPKHI